MQVEKLSGNPKPLDILAKINQIIDNMVVSVNGSGTDGNGNINVATIPVGFNYVQYPGESAPADLFGGEWENISAQFAGMFFRAEGGNAAAFGQSQSDGAPNITGSVSTGHSLALFSSFSGCFTTDGIYGGSQAGDSGSYSKGVSFFASASNGKYSLNEVRSANRTIRIWKRTA